MMEGSDDAVRSVEHGRANFTQLVVDEEWIFSANELHQVENKSFDRSLFVGIRGFQDVHDAENIVFFVKTYKHSELMFMPRVVECPPFVVDVFF
ncbi:unnamed protein product [Camellia sinensis]